MRLFVWIISLVIIGIVWPWWVALLMFSGTLVLSLVTQRGYETNYVALVLDLSAMVIAYIMIWGWHQIPVIIAATCVLAAYLIWEYWPKK